MNALEAKIRRIIATEGPISVAMYMALCLGDQENGYYMRRQAFGAKGDFITAPDVSQLFGEIIGVFLALCLDRLEAEKPVALVELGPGRGTLMADVLRTLKQLRPIYFATFRVELVETSPRLRALQTKAIAPYKVPAFHDSIDSLPTDRPLLIIGNEFLDALPMRQYVKTAAHWLERMVTVKDDRLAFTVGASTLAAVDLPPRATGLKTGEVFEVSPARNAIVDELAHRIGAQGGTALLVDYGHLESGFGDTFQAVRAHGFAPVLETPGEIDLTSHVDFEVLKKAAVSAGCQAALKTQGDFLIELGLLERARSLGAGKSGDVQADIQNAVQRLVGPDAMGTLFKVICFGNGFGHGFGNDIGNELGSLLPPPFTTSYA